MACLRKKESGLNLVEIVVIIVVMSLMVLAVVRYPDKKIALDTQVQMLIGDLRYAQFLAMTKNSEMRITFSTTQYSLSDATNTPVLWPSTNSANIVIDSSFLLTTDNAVLPNHYIIFDSQGVPYVSSTQALSNNAVISLVYGSTTQTVTVTPETGRVSSP